MMDFAFFFNLTGFDHSPFDAPATPYTLQVKHLYPP